MTAVIKIRWRRYGRYGGKWRADFPDGDGIEGSWAESTSLAVVERVAGVVAEQLGCEVVMDWVEGVTPTWTTCEHGVQVERGTYLRPMAPTGQHPKCLAALRAWEQEQEVPS